MAQNNTVEKGIIRDENVNYKKSITVLSVIIIGLIVLYYFLSQPIQPLKGPKLKGYSHLFSIYGVGPDRLYQPTEVAVDKETGEIHVADTQKSRIMVFDSNGEFITQYGRKGKGKYEFELPSSISIDDKGRTYVMSYTLGKLVIFNKKHKPVWEINFQGMGPLSSVVKGNKLYVTTRAGIMIGNLKGKYITGINKGGKAPGRLNRPTGIAVDDDGNIYVADSMNYRIQALNKRGKYLWSVGAPPIIKSGVELEKAESTRKFGLPESITLAPDGNLYVMDAFAGQIIILNKKGNILKTVGDWGEKDGQFYYPGGIVSAGGDKFVVADKYNDRVQVIRIPSPTLTISASFKLYLLIIIISILTALYLLGRMYYKRWKRINTELSEVV